MDSSGDVGILNMTMNEIATVASQVTGSSPCGGPALSFEGDNTITPASTYSTERNLPLAEIRKRPTLLDFTEQIRQLEIEGNKLRTSTMTSLGYLNGFNIEANDFEMPKLQSSSLSNLSSLIDISADQKYIADLRVQLEKQSKETERLQKQLLGDMSALHSTSTNSHHTTGHNMNGSFSHNISNGGNSVFLSHSQGPEKSAFSTIPNSELRQSFGRRHYDYEPPSHLERALKESQEQVMDLRKKLQEATDSSDQQKKQFRKTIEDLKSKLHDTILNRDSVLDLRQKESNSQEILINKLESSFIQLQENYKQLEEVLASTSKKLESHNQNNYLSETALHQIRSVLMERKTRRGQLYLEANSTSSHSAAMLTHTLEKCLQELDNELNAKTIRVSELEADINEVKTSSAERDRALAKEHQEILRKEADDVAIKISQLHLEQEQALADITETAAVARQQVTALQNQNHENETNGQQKLRIKELEIKDLEGKLDELKTDSMKTRALWQEKLIEAKHDQVATERLRQALETSLDQVQRELIETKTEKNELIQSEANLRSRLEYLQSLVSQYESDIETERDRIQQQRKREEDLRSQVMAFDIQVTNKQGDIDRLEKMLDVVKQECSTTVFDKVASAERLERERYLDQIKNLSTQLATMTERCNKVTVEQQLAKSEMDNLRAQVHDLTSKLEKARSQMESALVDKQDLTALLGDKHGNLDRLHRDKDYYMKLAEHRSVEATDLKINVERLKTQLDEQEKILSTFSQQSSSISQLMEVNAKASESIREEREKLASALTEKTAQVEELKAFHDSLNTNLKINEKRIKDLEDDGVKTTQELVVKSQELKLLQQEKDSIFIELKESRAEVANLVSSKDDLTKEVVRVRTLRSKDINKLQTKLKESEHGYKLSQKALRSKDIVDHRAVKFADKIQKEMTVKRSEIDQLLSKLHRLEESLEAVTKEKVVLEKDKESLKKGLAKSLLHTQQLSDELQKSEAKKRELAVQVNKLEEELEQAALKVSALSSMVEKCEQEITTLQLKHQLDIKEAERLTRNKSGNILPGTTGSSILSSDSTGQVKHRDYSEVGRELKSLVADMKNLVSGHKKPTYDIASLSTPDEEGEPKNDKMKTSKDLNVFLQVQDLRHEKKAGDKELQTEPDLTRSCASKSFTGLGDLSDFSFYKEWRPRSSSLTRSRRPNSCDHDMSFNTSHHSKNGHFDISRFSQSIGSLSKSTKRTSKVPGLLPDTQELCRRLEEKIDSLTRMGGNLVKENKGFGSGRLRTKKKKKNRVLVSYDSLTLLDTGNYESLAAVNSFPATSCS